MTEHPEQNSEQDEQEHLDDPAGETSFVEDIENDPAHNPDDPELKRMQGG